MNLFNYLLYCAAAPLHTVGCQDFWFYSMLTFVFSCFIFIAYLLLQIYGERRHRKTLELDLDYTLQGLKRIKTNYNI